jgi:transcriptional antiterminator RfaH
MKQSTSALGSATWIVVSTHPSRERIATENLERQSYSVYCPMVIKRVRHARRAYDARRPLFPGYIFVRLSEQWWRPILSTYGVRSIVRAGPMPAFLPFGFAESLKAREVDGAICKPDKPFRPGHAVRIHGGQFDGLIGRIIEIRERDRVLLLLELLNQQTKVHVDARMLRPA